MGLWAPRRAGGVPVHCGVPLMVPSNSNSPMTPCPHRTGQYQGMQHRVHTHSSTLGLGPAWPQRLWAALPAFTVRVHLHVPGVDGGVDDSPGAAPELRLGWDVDEHGLPVLPQAVHDVGTKLQHLVVHVCRKRTQRQAEWVKLERGMQAPSFGHPSSLCRATAPVGAAGPGQGAQEGAHL